MKYRVLKPFGSRSGLKIYQHGEIVAFPKGSTRVTRFLNLGYIEPFRYENKLPVDIRNMLQMWIDCNVNPIREICFLHQTYCNTGDVDADGFYCYEVFGYVNPFCDNRVAGQLSLRLDKPLSFSFEPHRGYTLEELGLKYRRINNGSIR